MQFPTLTLTNWNTQTGYMYLLYFNIDGYREHGIYRLLLWNIYFVLNWVCIFRSQARSLCHYISIIFILALNVADGVGWTFWMCCVELSNFLNLTFKATKRQTERTKMVLHLSCCISISICYIFRWMSLWKPMPNIQLSLSTSMMMMIHTYFTFSGNVLLFWWFNSRQSICKLNIYLAK